MRSRNFFLTSETKSSNTHSETVVATATNQNIEVSDVIVQSATPYHDLSDNNPYGNLNLFVSSRSVSPGSITVTFSKDSMTEFSNSQVDVIVVSSKG